MLKNKDWTSLASFLLMQAAVVSKQKQEMLNNLEDK
jgi:hypothetical protein